jgi:DNA-binding transcriptional LysR family regulator
MTLQQMKYAITIAECGSMNEAAHKLYITQPSLSSMIKELEKELGIVLFSRSNRGISITQEGEEFLGYARQIIEQYNLLQDRFVDSTAHRAKFSVSTQHYSFAVKAFIETAKAFGLDDYEFAIHETKTHDVLTHVRNMKSEIGILYLNDFNREALTKIFHEYALDFHPLFACDISVYLWKNHPLAGRDEISIEQLRPYPCLSFEQGDYNSFYFAEEVLSTYDYKRLIHASDRATLLNLMVGLNGYTLCSGIICEELNGDDYGAVKLASDEKMTIGYLTRKRMMISELGQEYIANLASFKDKVLE